ncbi:MAG: penicillin acylase family protein, partial [Nitriliruptoraceae bacterium]
TRHGPLFSDVSDAADELASGAEHGDDGPVAEVGDPDEGVEHAVALRWVALDPNPTMDALPALMAARDWQQFREAASRFEVPSQNLVYADVDGHIGYQAPGRIPVRRAGDGTLPVPGWTGDYGWDGYLDFEQLPWIVDPEAGHIVTANQPVLPTGQEPFLTADANPGYRAARLTELLEEHDQLSPEDLLELQLDERNGNADHLVPLLTEVEAEGDERVTAMQAILAGWDHVDAADSSGAAAFNATWRHLLARTFHPELPEFAHPYGNARWWEVVRHLAEDPDSPWWDDPTTDAAETRDDQLRGALGDAHDELSQQLGDDPEDWAWGELHTLELTHATFGTSGIAPVEAVFNRGPLELGGGSDIVNATGWSAPAGYEVNWVPSMRMVLDLGDLDAGRWIHLTGQSGRPFHRHYADQAPLWRDGETLPIAFSRDALEQVVDDRLTLVPGP